MNHKLVALAVTLTILGGFFVANIAPLSFSQSKPPAPPPSQKVCEQPVPWQGISSSSAALCKDIQSPRVNVNQGVVSLSFCGYPVWSYISRAADGQVDEAANELYKAFLIRWVKSQVGSRICCDRFQEAIQKGQACDPRVDIDCDGKPNGSDSLWSTEAGAFLPDINIYRKGEGSLIDRFPAGLDPDDPNFMPAADKCDCKWELREGTLTCSRDAKRPHVYQAKWRCPSTGTQLFTRKEARANAPCSKL